MAHTESKRVWGQTLATQQESVATVQGIQRDLAQAIGAGTATMGELEHQGAALGNIERNMDSIAASLGGADKALSAMEAQWNPFAWLWGGGKEGSANSSQQVATQKQTAHSQGESQKEQAKASEDEGWFRWPWSKAPAEVQAQQGEIDRGVDSVAESVAHLKGLALGLGETLDSHNQQLNRLGGKVDSNVEGVRQANRRVDGLL
eukprot:comp20166_c0_seq1/m.24973 comp20166_c0_seq1/g.24973  ORF comp20166_c0_seq1/g.24973 comp20166_c0_seq1/m.24973 type:complete len:204 (-) comp20166_c0_seq1:440-1051(-)